MRHLLSSADLDRAAAIRVLDTAEQMAATQQREIKKLPTLRGRTVVNLFFEDSTRTRVSFEAAAKRLSADVINFSAKGSSVSKGESLKDTALTLEAMGADAVVCRHAGSGAPHRLAQWVRGSVVNAGDGTHEHPTQALLDAFTMRRRLGRIEGLRVTIVGDILHSRVAALPDDAIVMHPGPMNRGVEIAADVADSARSTIVEQVANGVTVRMAVLYLMLGGLEAAE